MPIGEAGNGLGFNGNVLLLGECFDEALENLLWGYGNKKLKWIGINL
jgi:hypothetical protein